MVRPSSMMPHPGMSAEFSRDMPVSLSKILRMGLTEREDLIPLRSELEYVGYASRISRS